LLTLSGRSCGGPALNLAATPGRNAGGEGRSGRRLVLFLTGLAVFLLLVLLIRVWVLEPFQIASASMEPALSAPARDHPGDTILVNRLAYLFGRPARWEVVVFQPVDDPPAGASDSRPNLVKRLVGLPGETVEIEGGEIHVNGRLVPRPSALSKLHYFKSGVYGIQGVRLGPDEYFLLGDNSYPSVDSRRFGPVPGKNVLGRAVWIVWPPSRAGWIR